LPVFPLDPNLLERSDALVWVFPKESKPSATILRSDSRVPPELIVDVDFCELILIRVARVHSAPDDSYCVGQIISPNGGSVFESGVRRVSS